MVVVVVFVFVVAIGGGKGEGFAIFVQKDRGEDTKETKIFRSTNEFLICKVIVYVDQL